MPNKYAVRMWLEGRAKERKPLPSREQMKFELGIKMEECRREEEERAQIRSVIRQAR